MPSTVSQIFAAAGLCTSGVVPWCTPVPEVKPGVYVVALTAETETTVGALAACPVSTGMVADLLDDCPELTVDGSRPEAATLCDRLSAFWLPDEVVLYVGKAGPRKTGPSLRGRVDEYYKTPLGASRPHAGGWFLKTLTPKALRGLYVHYAPCSDPDRAKDAMIEAFSRGVSDRSRESLRDRELPIPFANLEWPKGRIKRHCIKGAKKPR